MHGMMQGRIPPGAGHHEAFRQLHQHVTGMVGICEDLPEEHNTVTLDSDLKDGDGIPAPKLDYVLSENSRKMLDFAVERGSEVLRAAGDKATTFANDPALLDQPMLVTAVEAAGVPHTSFKYAENTGQFQVIREQAGTFADSIKLWGAA